MSHPLFISEITPNKTEVDGVVMVTPVQKVMITSARSCLLQEDQVFFCGVKYHEEDFMIRDSDEVRQHVRASLP